MYVFNLIIGNYHIKVEQIIKYKPNHWDYDDFDIIKNLSEVPILCQIEDY